LHVVVHAEGNQMTIQEQDGRILRAMLAFLPAAVPHYCDDPRTQRRVGMTISREKQPFDFRMRTAWL
jgi:hypothetical protein